MQILYSHFKTENRSLEKSEKELLFSINKAYDLYHYLLLLIIDVADYAEERISIAQAKRVPTEEDLNPNRRFVDNKIINQLRNSRKLKTYSELKKLSWCNNPELIKTLYNSIKDSEQYNEYMTREDNSYKIDKQFISKIFEYQIANTELLYQILEEQSIFWNDDIEFVISMIMKTISKFKEEEEENVKLLRLYKNDEDSEFAKILLRKCILNNREYEEYISKFTKNWDVDRIAFMDILFMKMALGEILEMPSIPIKVSLNEYIEITKYYSTQRSSIFINGILDKVITTLKEEKKIVKQGRGLVDK